MTSQNPLVSIVVTTYFSAAYLERCLSSIKNQTYKNIELVIVDHNSTDGSQQIAAKYTDRLYFGQAVERSAKRNYGAEMARGRWVLIADSDMILSPGVIESCVKAAEARPEIKAVVVPEKSIGVSFWSRCKALERSFYVGVDWMEAARFFRRETFLEVGGYDVNNTGSEDYDLPQRIIEKYGQDCLSRGQEFAVQNEVDLGLIQSCRKKFYYAKSFPNYAKTTANKGNFQKQSSLLRRYGLFFSRPEILLQNPALGLGMLFMKTSEFVAGGMGYFIAKFLSPFGNSKSEQENLSDPA
jgi:glycosyltransferase involved in cell wall biosynthesis